MHILSLLKTPRTPIVAELPSAAQEDRNNAHVLFLVSHATFKHQGLLSWNMRLPLTQLSEPQVAVNPQWSLHL